MKRKRTLPIWTVVVLLLILLSACGTSKIAGKGVPDGIAELVILDYWDEQELQQSDYNSYSFHVIHNFDKKSNSDAAVINLQIEYNYATENLQIPVWYSYDRASDLWSLSRKGNWSDSVMNYHEDKLMGFWNIDLEGGTYNSDRYVIEIQSVSGNMVTLDYHIYEVLGNGSNSILSLDGNGTFLIDEYKRMQVIFDLPDGFSNYNGEDTADFYVWVNPQEGCCADYRLSNFLSYRPFVRSY